MGVLTTLLAGLAPGLFGAGGALAVGTLGGALFTAGVNVLLGVGAAFLAKALAPKPKPSENQIETDQAVPPRSFSYGRVKVSGPLFFLEARDFPNGVYRKNTLFKGVLISCREIDAFEELRLNDQEVEISDGVSHGTAPVGAVVTAPYVIGSPPGYQASLFTHLGSDSQTADTELMAAFPGVWTTEHRLRGIAYIVGKFECPGGAQQLSEVFPRGDPPISAVIRGVKVYDPRKDSTLFSYSYEEDGNIVTLPCVGDHRSDDPSTWEWSENSWLIVLDWLTFEDGYARPIDRIDLNSFCVMADVADEEVALVASGTEAQYRTATTVFLTEARKDVLSRLLQACGGSICRTRDGKVGARGGRWLDPTAALDADATHIRAIKVEEPDALSRYNEIRFQFLSIPLDYVEADGDPWRNEASIAAEGLKSQSADFTFVPSHRQARFLTKQMMARDNPERLFDLQATLAGLDCIGEETFDLAFAELGIDTPCWIDGGVSYDPSSDAVVFKARSADPDAFTWSTGEEGVEPQPPPDTSPDAPRRLDYRMPPNAFHWLWLNGL